LTDGGWKEYFSLMRKKKNPAAVALGRMGGKEISKRGSDYFRKLQAMRKHRKGGRPGGEKA
jgi:hypothetical protein